MKIWTTEIKALSPIDGELHTYGGPNVPGINRKDAYRYCEENGLGYCRVDGELICEIPCVQGTHEPDFDNMIDYELPRHN